MYDVLVHKDDLPCPLHKLQTSHEERIHPTQLEAIKVAIESNPENVIEAITDISSPYTWRPFVVVLAAADVLLLIAVFTIGIIIFIPGGILLGISMKMLFDRAKFFLAPLEEKKEIIKDILRKQTATNEKRRRFKIVFIAWTSLRRSITVSLARMGHTWVYQRQGAMVRASKPKLSRPMIGDDVVAYKVKQLPFRILFSDICNPETAEELSKRVGRECRIYEDDTYGVWVEVTLRSGAGGIKRNFQWYDDGDPLNALEQIPKNNRMVVALGIGPGRKVIYQDIRKMPHLLVAGATNQGKSVFLNQMICTLIKRNTPEQLNLILVDLKRGLEFGDYENLPHLKLTHGRIIKVAEEVTKNLYWLKQEKERRFALFDGVARDIAGYNQKNRTDSLPYIIMVIDELADLMLKREEKKTAEPIIIDLVQQGRAVGIHLIFATQIVTADVITRLVRSNFSERVAFRIGDNQGSQLIIETKDAADLPPIPGRMIYKYGADKFQLQAPYISPDQIRAAIAAAKGDIKEADFTPHNLIEFLLLNHEGKVHIPTIYADFKMAGIGRSKYWIQKTLEQIVFDGNGPVFNIGGTEYILAPHRVTPSGTIPRTVTPYTEYRIPIEMDTNNTAKKDFFENE